MAHALLFSILLSAGAAFAQIVRGTLHDARTLEPIVNANITVKGTRLGTTSDAQGRFILPQLPSRDVVLQISMMGYRSVQIPVMVEGDTAAVLDIELQPTVLQLGPVTVFGEKERDTISKPELESYALLPSETTISRREIQRQGAKTVVQVLNYLPGAWTETRGRKVKQFFSIRGQTYPYPEYVINGAWQREFLELPYFISSAEIEKIEVVRSSAALLTGLSSLNGVIKIQTRHYSKRQTTIKSEYGTFGSYQSHLSHGGRAGRFAYALGAGLQGTKGPEGRNAAERMANLYGRLSWSASEALHIDANVYVLNGERELAYAEPPAAKRFQQETGRFDPYKALLFNIKARFQPNESFSSEILIYRSERDPEWILQAGPDQPAVTASERDYELGVQWINALALSPNNVLRFGGLGNRWVAPNGKRFYLGRRTDLQTFSAVVVDEHNFGRLKLDAGLRWSKTHIDEYGAFGINGSASGLQNVVPIKDQWEPGILNASAGATWFLQSHTSLHLNLSTGRIEPRRGSLTTAMIEPEREQRLKGDLGLLYRHDLFGRLSLTAFLVRQKDAIVLSGETREVEGRILELYLNRDQDQIGVEFDFRSPPLFNLIELFSNFVFMKSRLEKNGEMEQNSEIPETICAAGLFSELSRFDANLFFKYVSGYQSTRFVARIQGQAPQPQPLGDFFTVNATLGWNPAALSKIRLYITFENLTDRRYSTVVGYPDFGRRVNLGFTYSL